MDELADFNRELLAEVQGDADAQGLITTEAFLEKMGDILDEAGEVAELHSRPITHCFGIGKEGMDCCIF